MLGTLEGVAGSRDIAGVDWAAQGRDFRPDCQVLQHQNLTNGQKAP